MRELALINAIKAGLTVGVNFTFKDEKGVDLVVNTVTGKIAGYADETTSKKKDGRLATVFNWKDYDGDIIESKLQSNRVLYLVYHPEVDVEDFLNGVINHINSCTWDNRKCNLELTTHSGNIRDGKMKSSVRKYYPEYFEIVHNKSKVDFYKLKDEHLWTAADILEYSKLDKGVVLTPDKYNKLYSKETVDGFLTWLKDKKNI